MPVVICIHFQYIYTTKYAKNILLNEIVSLVNKDPPNVLVYKYVLCTCYIYIFVY
jgi:hypothetical protein